MAIMLEIGQADLKTVWKNEMKNFRLFSGQPKEELLMKIVWQILTGIYEFHQRGVY
jgi:hypothetical protein